MNVKSLVRRVLRENKPLLKVSIQRTRALDLLPIPGVIVTRKSQHLPQVCLHSCIDANSQEVIELAVMDGTDDPGRTCHVPLTASKLAIACDCVFLGVVEYIILSHAWVRLEGWHSHRSQVESVVFRTGLKHESLGPET